MIVLASQNKEISFSRRDRSKTSYIPFPVFAQVVISAIRMRIGTVVGRWINHVGEDVFCIVDADRQQRSFIDTDIRFIVLGELWTQRWIASLGKVFIDDSGEG